MPPEFGCVSELARGISAMADADEPAEQRIDFTVPQASGICVVVPGVVSNIGKAIESLGGTSAVTRAAKDEPPELKFRTRPEDRLCHPLISASTPTQRILLKISVRRDQRCESSSKFRAEAVCRLPATLSFPGLFDFQVISKTVPLLQRSSPEVAPRNHPSTAEPSCGEQRLLVLPPVLARSNAPVEHVYSPSTGVERGRGVLWTLGPRGCIVAWSGTIPAATPAERQVGLLFSALHGLLDTQPIWLYPHLCEVLHQKLEPEMPSASWKDRQTAIDTALASRVYRFSTGPWAVALIRNGFDPRKDNSVWKLQVLSYELPQTWRGRIKEQHLARVHQTGTQAHATEAAAPAAAQQSSTFAQHRTLRYIPGTRVSHFQICHVLSHLPALVEFEQQTAESNSGDEARPMQGPSDAASHSAEPPGGGAQHGLCGECSERSGWLPFNVWKAATVQLTGKLDSLLPVSCRTRELSGTGGSDSACGGMHAPLLAAVPLPKSLRGHLKEDSSAVAATLPATWARPAGVHTSTARRLGSVKDTQRRTEQGAQSTQQSVADLPTGADAPDVAVEDGGEAEPAVPVPDDSEAALLPTTDLVNTGNPAMETQDDTGAPAADMQQWSHLLTNLSEAFHIDEQQVSAAWANAIDYHDAGGEDEDSDEDPDEDADDMDMEEVEF